MNQTYDSPSLHYKRLGLKINRTKSSMLSLLVDLREEPVNPKQREILSAAITVLQNLSEDAERAKIKWFIEY